jgi:hypothetical protein
VKESKSEGEATENDRTAPDRAAQFPPKKAAGGAAGLTLPAPGSAKPLSRPESKGVEEGVPSPSRADGLSSLDGIAFPTPKLNGLLTVGVNCAGSVAAWMPSSRANYSRRARLTVGWNPSRVALRVLDLQFPISRPTSPSAASNVIP